MNSINKTAFLTSLITLATATTTVPSNAQYIPETYNNCSSTQNVDYIVDSPQNYISSSTCIKEAVKTIYNPNPTWKPNL